MEKTPTHLSSRTAAMLMATAAILPFASHVASAHESSLVEREIARRAAQANEAKQVVAEGDTAYNEANYEVAVANYRRALDMLPPGPVADERRDHYIGRLITGSLELATNYRQFGRYDEARDLLEGVLEYDPANREAKQQLAILDNPIRTNPALTPEHAEDVDSVRKLLYRAEGYYNLGKFDEAKDEYREVLRIDPYNKAARRGMERCDQQRSLYYDSARDQARAELLAEVDKAWEIAVAPRVPELPEGDTVTTERASTVIRKNLQTLVPLIDLEDIAVNEAIDRLRQLSREYGKEVNFIIRNAGVQENAGDDEGESMFGANEDSGAAKVNIRLRNVPLQVVLDEICTQAKLRPKVTDHAVVLVPLNSTDVNELINHTFRVPPDFIAQIRTDSDGEGGGGGGIFDDEEETTGVQPIPPVKELLERAGISFPEGATATFLRGSSRLIVRNTPSNMDLVEALVNEIKDRKPKQIKIATKFVEISQENTDELGFDWIVTPFGLTANSLFLGGGTLGNAGNMTASDFVNPVNGVSIPGIPAGNDLSVSNVVTAGNRSGGYAITRDNIDAFLNNPTRTAQNTSVAPGIMSLTGLFTDGQVQMIMRGLAQKKGTDVMTAPSIVARSGERATIEIIREFIYPTEYEPPELPNSVGVGGGLGQGQGQAGGGSIFPVTPATPTAFETRNTGVTLEVEPTLGDDGYTIDLRFAPEIVEFEGFINYGSPIQSPATDALGNPISITITENRIEMPVFSTRRVNTGLTIYDGHTVAVGGLMREDVQMVEDKVPVLGDLPVVGRLFQSKAENHIKSNLIIFVSARIIDATGQPVRNDGGALTDAGSVLPTTL